MRTTISVKRYSDSVNPLLSFEIHDPPRWDHLNHYLWQSLCRFTWLQIESLSWLDYLIDVDLPSQPICSLEIINGYVITRLQANYLRFYLTATRTHCLGAFN